MARLARGPRTPARTVRGHRAHRRDRVRRERPIVLFDLATHRLVEAKILLPGVTTLERLIAALRERVAARQYALLAAAPSPNQAAVLENLVKVEQGRRVSRLDRLRKSPTDVSSTGLVKALDRHVELRDLGAAGWDLSAVPPGKIAALARFAHAARAQAVADLAGDRKLATLVAFAATMAPSRPTTRSRCSIWRSATCCAPRCSSEHGADAHPQRPRHRGDRAARGVAEDPLRRRDP
ncbi:DUF4158 domain-containing protein [Nonomuraea sp. NPDC050405]|uniref:DUF4158 domain-containing protein n=1 Tax=Nonomuraea sp. NPDC050405 TaxID=3154509 RepID=UPI0033F09E98